AGSRVLLKPNLLAKHPPQHAVTTHPAVLRAAIAACMARGVLPQDITVADSPGGLYNAATLRGIYRAAGYTAVCEASGAQLYTACESAPRKADGVLVREFNLIAPVHTADFIINLPKLKTHMMAGMTCAVKNLFGTIPGLQKAELHTRFSEKDRFGDMLVDLYACVAPNLHLVDGITAMEGDGPAGGAPRNVGVIFGGEDAFTVDLLAAQIIGISPAQVPYLKAAQGRGLCAQHFDAALLLGDTAAAAPVAGYRLPSGTAKLNFTSRVPGILSGAAERVMQSVAPRPSIARAKCIGCGKCAEICPAHTIAITAQKARIDPKHCIRCFCCHEVCPVKAIDVKRFGAFNL
ncbi:MAG: DUF362 domain-containing protein, partial [Ruthenibacterium sp.]